MCSLIVIKNVFRAQKNLPELIFDLKTYFFSVLVWNLGLSLFCSFCHVTLLYNTLDAFFYGPLESTKNGVSLEASRNLMLQFFLQCVHLHPIYFGISLMFLHWLK